MIANESESTQTEAGWAALALEATFGPVIAAYAALAADPARAEQLDGNLLRYVTDSNDGDPGGRATYSYEYLLVIVRKSVVA